MKRSLIIACLLGLTVLAQTALSPQSIDWRFTNFQWEDPNPPGSVAFWTVYASNSVTVKKVDGKGTIADPALLLTGSPAGVYALFNVPVGPSGEEGEPSTNLFVKWPGGNGKLRGGTNLKVNK